MKFHCAPDQFKFHPTKTQQRCAVISLLYPVNLIPCFTTLAPELDITLIPILGQPKTPDTHPVQRWWTNTVARVTDIPPLRDYLEQHAYDPARLPSGCAQQAPADPTASFIEICPPSLTEGGELHAQIIAGLWNVAGGAFTERLELSFRLPLPLRPEGQVIAFITITGHDNRTLTTA